MAKVHAQITAFDKHSNRNTGISIVADTKKSFNSQVEEFEDNVEYSRFYTTITVDEILTPKQEIIVEDHEIE